MRYMDFIIVLATLILTTGIPDRISAQCLDSLIWSEYGESIMKNDSAYTSYQKLMRFFERQEAFPDYYGGSFIDDEHQFVVLVVDSLLREQRKLLEILEKDEFLVKPCKHSYKDLRQVYDALNNKLKDTTCAACKNVLITMFSTEENRIIVFLKEYSESRIAEFRKKIMDSPMLEFSHGRFEFHG